eukprot:1550679-Rhodomonas_salina.1
MAQYDRLRQYRTWRRAGLPALCTAHTAPRPTLGQYRTSRRAGVGQQHNMLGQYRTWPSKRVGR